MRLNRLLLGFKRLGKFVGCNSVLNTSGWLQQLRQCLPGLPQSVWCPDAGEKLKFEVGGLPNGYAVLRTYDHMIRLE